MGKGNQNFECRLQQQLSADIRMEKVSEDVGYGSAPLIDLSDTKI